MLKCGQVDRPSRLKRIKMLVEGIKRMYMILRRESSQWKRNYVNDIDLKRKRKKKTKPRVPDFQFFSFFSFSFFINKYFLVN